MDIGRRRQSMLGLILAGYQPEPMFYDEPMNDSDYYSFKHGLGRMRPADTATESGLVYKPNNYDPYLSGDFGSDLNYQFYGKQRPTPGSI